MPDKNVRRARIAVNGVSIGVVECGMAENPPLVLLHGFTGSALSWGSLLDTFAEYGLRVIALDMLGHGESDAPADPARYAIDACQADILAVLRVLEVQQGEAILLGYSMGGRIALYSAFSGFFRALVLESASPGLETPLEREQRCHSDRLLAERIEQDGIAAFVDYWEQLPLFASQQSLSLEKRTALHKQRLRNNTLGLANSLRGVGTGVQPGLHRRLSALKLPVQLLTGSLDIKFCAIARQMVRVLPQAQWEVIPDAGHATHIEQPELFIRAIEAFCTNIGHLPG
jgi:2-succinyl-6-hydroxy-2,4-cyclohexadiene-1-carboxylate synthase